jgi:hypothetical protein
MSDKDTITSALRREMNTSGIQDKVWIIQTASNVFRTQKLTGYVPSHDGPRVPRPYRKTLTLRNRNHYLYG